MRARDSRRQSSSRPPCHSSIGHHHRKRNFLVNQEIPMLEGLLCLIAGGRRRSSPSLQTFTKLLPSSHPTLTLPISPFRTLGSRDVATPESCLGTTHAKGVLSQEEVSRLADVRSASRRIACRGGIGGESHRRRRHLPVSDLRPLVRRVPQAASRRSHQLPGELGYGETKRLFRNPSDPRTEDSITG